MRMGLLFALFLFATTIMGCSDRTNEFIVPNGFRGAIQIQTGVHDGAVGEAKGNAVTYVVPRSGILQLRDSGPFTEFERLRARYDNGTILPTEHELTIDRSNASEDLSQDVVKLWFLFTSSTGDLWLYIGTYDEYLEAASRGSGNVIPGKQVLSK